MNTPDPAAAPWLPPHGLPEESGRPATHQPGAEIGLDLAPRFAGDTVGDELLALKRGNRQTLANARAALLPKRLAEGWLHSQETDGTQRMPDAPDRTLRALAQSLCH